MDPQDFTRSILDKINDSLLDEIGPVALVLCEEAEREWNDELEKKKIRKNLRSILLYIDRIALYIDNPDRRENFTNAVYEINGLKGYKT